MPGAELADRVIRMLVGNFFQRADLLIHIEAGRVAMIENVVRQYPQACRDGLGVPADHRFGVAAFNQLLYLFRLVQADGDMLL